MHLLMDVIRGMVVRCLRRTNTTRIHDPNLRNSLYLQERRALMMLCWDYKRRVMIETGYIHVSAKYIK